MSPRPTTPLLLPTTPSTLVLPKTKHVHLSLPTPQVLLVTIANEKAMNALNIEACWEMDRVWKWVDACADIRIAILTGAGQRSFCSGMDLKERLSFTPNTPIHLTTFPTTGFGGLTRRVGLKPIIAAINGHAHGGGFELALNADIVLAAPHATFRLPDVVRGTAALQGALPRLVRTVGMQRASLVALTGYEVNAEEAKQWGIVAEVVEAGKLVERAVELARRVAEEASPDSVVATRAGLREAWETGSVERATQLTGERWHESVFGGGNMKEGIRAFVERRAPRWGPLGVKSTL